MIQAIKCFLVISAICFAGLSQSYSAPNKCEELFLANTPPPAFGKTNSHPLRESLLEGLRARIRQVQQSQRTQVSAFLTILHEIRKDNFSQVSATIRGQSRLFAQDTPPPIVSDSTLSALLEAFADETGLRSTPLNPLFRDEAKARARVAFKLDLYSRWLQNNGADLRSQREFQQMGSHSFSGSRAQPLNRDPGDILFSYIENGGNSRLPVKVSIVRLMRDFDPKLNPNLIFMANQILWKQKIIVALQKELASWIFSESDEVIRMWPAVADENAVQEALAHMQLEVETTFGKIVPRAAYREALSLIKVRDPALAVIANVNTIQHGQAKISDRDFKVFIPHLIYLRKKTRLPSAFELRHMEKFFHALVSKGVGENDYESFVVELHSELNLIEGVAVYGFLSKYKFLKQISQLQNALLSDTNFLRFTEKQVRALKFDF